MSVKRLSAYSFIALIASFSVALAVVVGTRMSAEAMAVVIGVVCGVGSSIPMSAIILLMTRRPRPRVEEFTPQPARPPVVVVTQPAAPLQQQPAPWPGYGPVYPPAPMPMPREFRIIGEE